MVRWLRWHCPPDTGFEIRALAVRGRARYLSVTKAPHNTDCHTWMGKKHFCFFQTAETENRTPNSGVKGSGAKHYPRAPARRQLQLPVDIQLEFFDILVKPILLYGCKVWATESVDIIKKIHLRFCKYVLQVNKSTCPKMVYGELGVTPLVLHAKSRMVILGARIYKSSSTPKLSNVLYQLIFNLYNRNTYMSPWLSTVKNTLEGCVFSGV